LYAFFMCSMLGTAHTHLILLTDPSDNVIWTAHIIITSRH
jgi:hypothetical protein